MSSLVGQQIGDYLLIQSLGTGAFGKVYLGRNVYTDALAAIKMLHEQILKEPDAKQAFAKFLQEAKIIARLEHRNIVQQLGFSVHNQIPFLMLEYAQQGNLRSQHPKGSVLPLPTIVTYVNQIADALQHAHDQKVIHRDLKPENVLMRKNGEVLVSDFGIATIAHRDISMYLQNLAGTLAYMAPEQIRGMPSSASDQYSLAIMVYEWLCGDRPFHGSTTAEYVHHQIYTPPPSLRAKVPSIPVSVEQVVMKALSKNPNERYGSVTAFAQALKQAVIGQNRAQAGSNTGSTVINTVPPTVAVGTMAKVQMNRAAQKQPQLWRQGNGKPNLNNFCWDLTGLNRFISSQAQCPRCKNEYCQPWEGYCSECFLKWSTYDPNSGMTTPKPRYILKPDVDNQLYRGFRFIMFLLLPCVLVPIGVQVFVGLSVLLLSTFSIAAIILYFSAIAFAYRNKKLPDKHSYSRDKTLEGIFAKLISGFSTFILAATLTWQLLPPAVTYCDNKGIFGLQECWENSWLWIRLGMLLLELIVWIALVVRFDPDVRSFTL